MNEMNAKKLYIWKLAIFLCNNKMNMSAKELADHLNRNRFLTSYGTEFKGKRGTYKLIKETWKWVHDDLGLDSEAKAIAFAFVKSNNRPAYL